MLPELFVFLEAEHPACDELLRGQFQEEFPRFLGGDVIVNREQPGGELFVTAQGTW